MDSFFFQIVPFLFLPVAILVLLIYVFIRMFRSRHVGVTSINAIAFSREDGVGQVYIFFACGFLWIALGALNIQIGAPLSNASLLLVMSILGLVLAYWKRILLLLPFSLIGLSSWWLYRVFEWGEPKEIKSATYFSIGLFTALLLYSLSFLHKKKFGFMRAYMVYTVLGLLCGTSSLFFLSTRTGLEFLQYMTRGVQPYGSWEIMLSIVVVLAAFISVLVYSVGEKFISPGRALFIGGLALVPVLLIALPEQTLFLSSSGSYESLSLLSSLTGSGIMWLFVFNLLLFAELVALILSGYAEQETWRVNLGTFFLFLFIGIKYFDFFSLLDKSVFFIGAGILLCGMGFFMEKGRKKMVGAIREGMHVSSL